MVVIANVVNLVDVFLVSVSLVVVMMVVLMFEFARQDADAMTVVFGPTVVSMPLAVMFFTVDFEDVLLIVFFIVVVMGAIVVIFKVAVNFLFDFMVVFLDVVMRLLGFLALVTFVVVFLAVFVKLFLVMASACVPGILRRAILSVQTMFSAVTLGSWQLKRCPLSTTTTSAALEQLWLVRPSGQWQRPSR